MKLLIPLLMAVACCQAQDSYRDRYYQRREGQDVGGDYYRQKYYNLRGDSEVDDEYYRQKYYRKREDVGGESDARPGETYRQRYNRLREEHGEVDDEYYQQKYRNLRERNGDADDEYYRGKYYNLRRNDGEEEEDDEYRQRYYNLRGEGGAGGAGGDYTRYLPGIGGSGPRNNHFYFYDEFNVNRGDAGRAGRNDDRYERYDYYKSNYYDHEDHYDSHSYTFMVTDEYRPWTHMAEDGHLQGLEVDLVEAVCAEAGKRCYVVMDESDNCWDVHDEQGEHEAGHPGYGLMDGWYDGCVGFFPTPERLASFNFTDSFSENFHATLYYNAGEVPENYRDITGKKVGMVDGWPVDEFCLGRQANLTGNHEGEYYPVYYADHKAMLAALQAHEIDAALSADKFAEDTLEEAGVESMGYYFDCTSGGAAVMARYDSSMIYWWNRAFEHKLADGSFAALCDAAQEKYGSYGPMFCYH